MTAPCREMEARLDALLDGALDAAERAALERHVAACEACATALEASASVKALVAALPALEPVAGDLARALGGLDARAASLEAPARPSAPRSLRGASPRRARPAPGRLLRVAAVAVALASVAAAIAALLPSGASLAYAPGLFVHYAYAPPARALPPAAPTGAVAADLGGIAGADAVALSAAERAALAAGGVIWRPASEASLADFYAAGETRGAIPLFTPEAALLLLARALAATDARLEAEVVRPGAAALLAELDAALARDLGRATSREAKDAIALARDVVAVGRELASERVELSPRARDEVALIRAGDGIATSPLTGAREDYALYAGPTDAALLWLERSPLPLDDPAGARAALALVHALVARDAVAGRRPIERYERIRERLAFFHGAPVNWPPERLLPELRRLCGARLELDVAARDPAIVDALARLAPPEIAGPAGARPLFSLLGVRHAASARATAALTGPRRVLGSGLDVLAATGFAGARGLLFATAGAADPALGRRLAEVERTLAPHREEDDLFWLVDAARRELAPPDDASGAARDRALDQALVSLDVLELGAGLGWRPGAIAARAALDAPPGERESGAIDGPPAFYARLEALARAVAAALRDGDDFPSREALAGDLDALEEIFARLAAGDRAIAARAAGIAAALGPGSPGARAAVLVDVVARPGAEAYQTRVDRGPIEVLALVPRPGRPGEVALARGAGVAAFEVALERRIDAADVDRLPALPLPTWLRSWRAP